jgi:hypothetical protein
MKLFVRLAVTSIVFLAAAGIASAELVLKTGTLWAAAPPILATICGMLINLWYWLPRESAGGTAA